MKRAKKLPKGIGKARKDGPFRKGKRWGIDVFDSKGARHRPTFATKEEAQRAYDAIKAQKTSGEFLARATTATFNDALDLLVARTMTAKHKPLAPGSSDRVKAITSKHLRELGTYKLSEFPDSRMRIVKDWLAGKAPTLATRTLAHLHSGIKLALDLAIAEGLMGAPNPMKTFNVGVPVGVDPPKRKPLRLDEIAKLVRTLQVRRQREYEASFRVRFVMSMIGLLTALRDGEVSGLYWDCIGFDERMIYVRRSWRRGVGTVDLTKTGELGFRDIPMSPILHAVLGHYRDQLRELGLPAEGEIPVLCTDKVNILRPEEIGNHWDRIAYKCGFVGEAGRFLHTFYALRHTGACLWRAAGIDLEHLKELMGHTDIKTTSDRYLHKVPSFGFLLREVDAVRREFDLDRSPQGIIDALGIVLARLWREEGVEIPCAPPQAAVLRLARPDQTLLPAGNGVIDGKVLIDGIATTTIEVDASAPAIRSLQDLREWQRSECKRLAALGWKHSRIADHIGIDKTTVSNMVRASEEQTWLRKMSRAKRAELRAESRRMRIEEDATNAEIARVLNVSPHRMGIWLHDVPMKNWRRASQKYGPHEALIRQRFAEGKTPAQIAREIGAPKSTGVIQFAERLGIYKSTKRR